MTSAAPQPQVDLNSCASEPIHIPGRIQSFGALVAVSPDWLIAHRSANLGEFLGLGREPAAGESIKSVIGEKLHATLRQRLQLMPGTNGTERLFGVEAVAGSGLVDVALHVSGRNIVIEFERHDSAAQERHLALLRPMMSRLEQASSPEQLCEAAARQIRMLLGYDRVMVYKFHHDDSGEVIAEARAGHLESFFGLRYPASDIPPQARALYLRNVLRIISDVADPTLPIEPVTSPAGIALDLSHSTLRAVSPIHIEYLKNMGVGASLSISIVLRGKLWGLFACHHYSPRVLDYSLRSTAELFAQLFSLLLDQRISDSQRTEVARGQAVHDQLMAQLAESSGLMENFDTILALIAPVIPHDGACALIEGEYVCEGSAPGRDEFLALVPFLNTIAVSSIFATDSLSRHHPPALAYADVASGALVIPVSRRPRDYIVLWRRELVHAVRWAGNPEKPVHLGPNGARLTPRKSFEAWQEVVRGTSAEWSDEQVRAAESLRITLLEVILRITDSAMQERARAHQQQELLIAELNHRVRNILGLIRALISQSGNEVSSVAEFTQVVGGRIHALSLAHDNITRDNWSATSLKALIRSECEAYLSGKADRIRITGDDVLVEPEAYSVLALVLHEMLTNSAKYGALCDSKGLVTVSLSRGAHNAGDLKIAWRETGGPAVRAPKRRGFGTTIIERSIPYELKGSSDVRYKLHGLEADFSVPERYITNALEATIAPEKLSELNAAEGAAKASRQDQPRRVLVLEDNMIIALDAEECLLDLGVADVVLVSSNDGALAAIRSARPDFALLDFNLGSETSEPTAQALVAAGVPFAFATGYGELDHFTGAFERPVKVIQKPYSKADLERAISDSAYAD